MREEPQMSENEPNFEEGGAESETHLAICALSRRRVRRLPPSSSRRELNEN